MNLVFWEVHLAESQDLIMWPSKLLSHLTFFFIIQPCTNATDMIISEQISIKYD